MKKGQFCRLKSEDDVYYISKVTKNTVTVDHCVRDKAWTYSHEEFKADSKKLVGKELQRVIILSDVIQQLNTKHFVAQDGIYGRIYLKHDFISISNPYINKNNANLELKEVIDDSTQCNACAIGSLFLSAVDIHDNLKLGQLCEQNSDGYLLVKFLEPWFDNLELRLMESVFEQDYKHSTRIMYKLEAELDGYKTYSKMLDVLLREIIANTIKYKIFSPQCGVAK